MKSPGTSLLLVSLLALSASISVHAASDLDMLGLKGNVRVLHVDYDEGGVQWCADYAFDNDGNLLELGWRPVDLERDAMSRIIRCTVAAADEDGTLFMMTSTYAYDNHRRVTAVTRVTPDARWTESYSYSPDGRVIARTCFFSDGDESLSYSYDSAVDATGNWISRTGRLDGSAESLTESRLIVYDE